MTEILGYVVVNTGGDPTDRYYALDQMSGGYPYWSGYIGQAEIFKTEIQASKVINNPEFGKTNHMSDGTLTPHYMIHSAIGLCNVKLKGSCTLSVRPLILGDATKEKSFFGEIKKPTGYNY